MDTIGKYKIIKVLGSGGFGVVYLCEDQLGQQVAIKIFQPKNEALAGDATSTTSDSTEALKQRFQEEAKILHQLSDNPYIVNFMHYDETEDGTPYYVMPYLDRCLVDEIGKDAFSDGVREDLDPALYPCKLPVARAIEVLEQSAQALRAVHRAGLVHRDIKPANILLDKTGQVQLCDFGIAKLPDVEQSQSVVGMGSRNYMSPEQRESAKQVKASSDIYSLGVMAYRMLTGVLPQGRYDDPIALTPAVGEVLNDLILQCMAVDPSKRPQNSGEFIVILKSASAASSVELEGEDDSTGTWIERGKSDLKDELKPLRDSIAVLLRECGEIPTEEFKQLSIQAKMSDLNDEALNRLIEDTYESIEKEVKPKRKFLEVLDKTLSEKGALDKADYDALIATALSIGWDENKLETLIKKRKQMEKKTTHGQSVQWLGVLLLLSTIAYGAWWVSEDQTLKAEIATQKVNEKKVAEENERLAWQQVQKEYSIEAYRFYLDTWPEGAYKTKADIALRFLEAQSYIALVSATQTELKRIGYQVDQFDGNQKKQTADAIQHYQLGSRLSVTGEASDSLLNSLKQATKKPLVAGDKLKHCSSCPEMIVIPAGSFQMGSNQGNLDEKPVHRVVLLKPLAVGMAEITWDNYQPCINARVCKNDEDEGWGKGDRPVINVSWNDIQTYIKWLNDKTSQKYRLPSEAEWEYAARAGSSTKYFWGNNIGNDQANCNGCFSQWGASQTAPVKSYQANDFGLYDMHGNVWEWTGDCWSDNYHGAPNNGAVWEAGDCTKRVLRGSSWNFEPVHLRSANRHWNAVNSRYDNTGFRLVLSD